MIRFAFVFLAAVVATLPCVVLAQAVTPTINPAADNAATRVLLRRLLQARESGHPSTPLITDCASRGESVRAGTCASATCSAQAVAICQSAEAVAPKAARPIIHNVIQVMEAAEDRGCIDAPSEKSRGECWHLLEEVVKVQGQAIKAFSDSLDKQNRRGTIKVEYDQWGHPNLPNTRIVLEEEALPPPYTPAMTQPLVPPAPVPDTLVENLLQGFGGCLAGTVAGAGTGYLIGKDARYTDGGKKVQESTRLPYAVAVGGIGCATGGAFGAWVF